ncbi:TetR/AcrR family transcriptional regulator [Salipiger mucosus]|uniref:Transcriptional regulator, TetR family n=1 Tax=Salipiger mucosus DSM 16094 TaxID=1123237 RepID=S9QJ11_9RHOB|nr:TetR/AcrR family transcriptional regulator [Salipiger mucosus]EPX81441.1 Transcriptional regulator, TetR family [Salipiger mucosus DSM 16094]
MNEARTDTDDPKAAAILDAAFRSFAAYGFRRTSMEDIARGAGMSRPALYLHFANKEAILRALVSAHHDRAVAGVSAALAQGGTPEEALTRAFLTQTGERVETMLNSPHGPELLETSGVVSADISREGVARMVAVYADWLEAGETDGSLRLAAPARLVAETIVGALQGIKAPPYDGYVARIRALAQVIGRGLAP